MEGLLVPCELLCQQQLPLLAKCQGRLAVWRTFCWKQLWTIKPMFYCSHFQRVCRVLGVWPKKYVH